MNAGAARAAKRLSILVGAPNDGVRRQIVARLREQGQDVLEAASADEVRTRLAEFGERTSAPLDLVLCAGLFTEKMDSELAARLSSPEVSRALILLPAGSFLSTAARAHKLGAAAVVPEVPGHDDLWALLQETSRRVRHEPALSRGSGRPA